MLIIFKVIFKFYFYADLAVNVLSTSTDEFSMLKPKIHELFDLFHNELAKLPQNTVSSTSSF